MATSDDTPAVSPLTRRIRLLSVLLYVISLGLPGLTTDPVETDFSRGLPLLLLGWLGLFEGVVAWLANPCVWCAWIAMNLPDRTSRRIAIFTSTLAIGFALSLLLYDEISQASSSGDTCRIVGLGSAYWTWVASSVCAWIGAILEWRESIP